MAGLFAKETILITGASSGFGRATAEKCAAAGARLILAARRLDKLEEIQKAYPEVPMHLIALDVRDRAAVEGALEALPEGFKDVTVLVNNAGLALGAGSAQEADLDQWEQMVDTNIKGVMYMTRTLLPRMVARKEGYVINIGSMAGHYPYPGSNAYGGTKAFVEQFSLGLRADLLGTQVRVTDIAPGLAETEFSLVRFSGDEAKAKELYQNAAALTAEDVAEAVHWCISRPKHVNITTMEIMPTCQATSSLAIFRQE
jgi:NADP-dependent 3-hydroxy acid dehydrogenase YdfG